MIAAAAITTMIFYNQVLGVSAALCGTAFLIASLIDGFSDPIVGAFSDSVNTRWGRRHPFMFAAALPMGIFFYLLYQPPRGAGGIPIVSLVHVYVSGSSPRQNFLRGTTQCTWR